jgi:hypothetical protein
LLLTRGAFALQRRGHAGRSHWASHAHHPIRDAICLLLERIIDLSDSEFGLNDTLLQPFLVLFVLFTLGALPVQGRTEICRHGNADQVPAPHHVMQGIRLNTPSRIRNGHTPRRGRLLSQARLVNSNPHISTPPLIR